MRHNVLETLMGVVVLAVAGVFLLFAWHNADLGEVKGYNLTAGFQSVGGLPIGADVRVNGVKVGSVVNRILDPNTFTALVTMSIAPEFRLPSDTVATIASEGLMGGAFVKLDPGKATDFIPADGQIRQTRSSRSIEEMVGEVIFLATSDGPQPAHGDLP